MQMNGISSKKFANIPFFHHQSFAKDSKKFLNWTRTNHSIFLQTCPTMQYIIAPWMLGSTNVDTHLYLHTCICSYMKANVLIVIFLYYLCFYSSLFVLLLQMCSTNYKYCMIQKCTHGGIQALSNKAGDNFPECTSDKQTHAIVEQWTSKCDMCYTLWN